MTTLAILYLLLAHLGHPKTIERAVEISNTAAKIAWTNADADEAAELATIAIHETGCVDHPAWDGSACFGEWQVCGERTDAGAALELLRWSERTCGKGDLSLYAGCGRCGACPEIVASLLDPTLPRR
jgi:hypothetical protein